VGEGLGFAWGVDRTEGRDAVRAQDSWPELEDDLTGGLYLSVSNERGRGTLSGLHVAGPRAELGIGPVLSPGPFFFFFSFFSFSVLPFLSYILQNRSKTLQLIYKFF
jgi:hypothetical protein